VEQISELQNHRKQFSFMQPDADVIKRWTGSAPFWEKHRDIIHHMFAPVSQSLAEAAGVATGSSVLDVATGPGEPALSLAAIVGPEGRVCGVDPIPGMVEAARREADRLGFGNAQFEVAFADALPYPDATFDAVVSRFGVMFFVSPADGVREMLRVLRPGGKLALGVWCSAERNPFHWALSRVVRKHVDSPLPDPDAPDAFRFAPKGKLRNLLVEAGVPNPVEHLLQFRIEAPLPIEEFLQLRLEMSEKLRETFAAFSPEELAEARREMFDSLGEFATGSAMSFPAEVLIVSATR
jgi:ubiquinone/menaquinone biosynthesis C-methylase UbiE